MESTKLNKKGLKSVTTEEQTCFILKTSQEPKKEYLKDVLTSTNEPNKESTLTKETNTEPVE